MKIKHDTETLLGLLNTTEDELKAKVLKTFHRIREGHQLSDEELAESIVHAVAAYDGHQLIVLPALGTIYGLNTEEFNNIANSEFSYQLEAILKYGKQDIRDFITNIYFYTVLKNEI